MAGKSDFLESLYLNLIFKGITNAAWASNAGTATTLYVSFHTADPTDAGTQTSNEVSYTGYARVATTRGSGWTVTGNSVSPSATVNLPPCTAGTVTALYWAVGDSASGAGNILYAGQLNGTTGVSIAPGVTPQLSSTSTITED